MPKLRFEGRQIGSKREKGMWVNTSRKESVFISYKLISNFVETPPVKGCDGSIEFEVPEWLLKKNESLCSYCA